MKTLTIVFCLLCASAAFGQTVGVVLNNQPQIIQVPSHPEHASQQLMAENQSLLISYSPVQAHGERPLWEVGKLSPSVPLGDVARALRREHELARKSKAVWEN